MTEPKTYRLGSSDFANSHGMVRWAINGYHFPKDRKAIANVFVEGWKVPQPAVHALLSEAVPFTVEGTDDMPVVVFTFEMGASQ
jgi:hypothetical protein